MSAAQPGSLSSGLSITEWKPIHGVIPPLNDAEWQDEFAKYKQIPQFSALNPDMDLTGFKRIFWWEWAHRLLARWAWRDLLRAASCILLADRAAGARPASRMLGGIFAAGRAAGRHRLVDGGFRSGRARTSVSPYRLAAAPHRSPAVIFTATMVVARGLAPHSGAPAGRSTQRFAGILVLLVLVQIYLGGLVAGLDAGLSYNTWPLMDGSVIPGDLFVIDPALAQFLRESEDGAVRPPAAAPISLLAAALWHMIATRRAEPGTTHARRALVLFHLVLLQAAIGIVTLLTQVHLHAGTDPSGLGADRARLRCRALARDKRQLIRCRRMSKCRS